MTPLREFFTTGISDNWNRGKSQRRKLGAVDAGIKEESAYYESLHEVPLIANLIDRKRLYEMNRVISDTAECGPPLFLRRSTGIRKSIALFNPKHISVAA